MPARSSASTRASWAHRSPLRSRPFSPLPWGPPSPSSHGSSCVAPPPSSSPCASERCLRSRSAPRSASRPVAGHCEAPCANCSSAPRRRRYLRPRYPARRPRHLTRPHTLFGVAGDRRLRGGCLHSPAAPEGMTQPPVNFAPTGPSLPLDNQTRGSREPRRRAPQWIFPRRYLPGCQRNPALLRHTMCVARCV